MQTIPQLQQAIGRWSEANFGKNWTNKLATKEWPLPIGGVYLDWVAPLMGIAEEIGELHEPVLPSKKMDAVGDIMVYLADFCHRRQIEMPVRVELSHMEMELLSPTAGIVVAIGRLFHCHLKNFQGIRKNSEPSLEKQEMAAVVRLVYYLGAYCRENFKDDNLITIFNETWNNVVSKRDWKKHPDDGVGETAEAESTPPSKGVPYPKDPTGAPWHEEAAREAGEISEDETL